MNDWITSPVTVGKSNNMSIIGSGQSNSADQIQLFIGDFYVKQEGCAGYNQLYFNWLM